MVCPAKVIELLLRLTSSTNEPVSTILLGKTAVKAIGPELNFHPSMPLDIPPSTPTFTSIPEALALAILVSNVVLESISMGVFMPSFQVMVLVGSIPISLPATDTVTPLPGGTETSVTITPAVAKYTVGLTRLKDSRFTLSLFICHPALVLVISCA